MTYPVPGGATFLRARSNLTDLASDTTAMANLVAAGGLPPYSTGYTAFSTGGVSNPLNMTSGGNGVPIAGEWNYAAMPIWFNATLTGLVVCSGNLGGTDEWILALWSGAGGLPIATTALAGTAAPATNTKVRIPFTAPVNVEGPGLYFAGLQSNGTTAKYLSFPNSAEGFATGQVAGTFGTPLNLTPPTTYAANVGPFLTTY